MPVIGVRRHLLFPAVLLLALLRPATAHSDLLNGFTEWDYSHLSSRTRDVTGSETMTKGDALTQKYSLMLSRNFFPLLTMRAGYLFELDQNWLTSEGEHNDATIKTSLPSADLTLGTPLLNAGIGYYRRKESTTSSGAPGSDLYTEDYHGFFNWRPEGLPTLNLNLERANIFDGRKLSQDVANDRASLGLAYRFRELDLKYSWTYSDHQDRLEDTDVTQTTHSGRVAYSDQLFQDRVSFYSVYNFSQQTTTSGMQVAPFVGLFALGTNPAFGALEPMPALIDGDVRVSSGINIGTTTEPQPPVRNLGVDLLNPTAVNRILVWLDSRPPQEIVKLFAWDIYVSSDNLTWTRVTAAPLAGLSPDPVDNKVQLDFPAVTSRYLKVVVAPLPQQGVQNLNLAGVKFPLNIYVTELQVLNEQPAAAKRNTSVLSHILNLDTKVKLLEGESLFLDSSFYLVSIAPGGFTKWTLANALLADHRFNDLVTVSGRVGREDSDEPLGHRDAYVYNATLRVTPFKTLSHTLAYNGRTESFQGRTNQSDGLYLSNTAELYRGVNLNLSGGASNTVNDTGEKILSYSAICSLNLVPRSDLTMNLAYNLNNTDLSGGAQREVNASTSREDVGMTYRPFTTLYLLASFGFLQQTSRKSEVVQNYGVNWSPFPDGTLLFNFTYQENLSNLDQEHSRLISPGLTWKITSRAALDLAAPLLKTSSASGTTTSETVSANLRLSF